MSPSSLAGIVTACASLFTAVALVITAVTALLRARKIERKVDDVHVIVNQQRTDMERYQRALIRSLEGAGVQVPIDQSKGNDDGS